MARLFRIALVLLLILGSTPAIYAQGNQAKATANRSTFDPENPAEPDNGYEEPIVYYKVKISSNPASVAYVSSGGEFAVGSSKYIYTSRRNSKYTFSHWTLNGEYYSNRTSFTYVVETMDANFVAHYEFAPSSPVEPDPLPEIKVNPLYLATNIEGACSFNQASGNEYEEEVWVELEAYPAKGYEFKGWYSGTTLVSSSAKFNYQMPGTEVTLTANVARVVFSPDNPSEPDSSQEDVQTTPVGDVNKDGVVNVFDIIAVVNYSLAETDENLSLYDLNGDGAVNVFDIIKVVNISLE